MSHTTAPCHVLNSRVFQVLEFVMRTQSLMVFLALLVLAALAALNLGALTQPSGVSLGWRQLADAPLGLVVLGAAVLGLLLSLAGGAMDQRRQQLALRQALEEVQAQRTLANQAEGSRFTELQRHLDLQAQAAEHRAREVVAQLTERLDHMEKALHLQTDQVGNSLAAYIGEVEDRLERRERLWSVDPTPKAVPQART
jgi:uncharacterized integral membrane protein